MRRLVVLIGVLFALSGCIDTTLSPSSYSVSFPDTTFDSSTSTQVIPSGQSSFRIQITFGEPITGFEASDLVIDGGTITSFSSNAEGTVHIIDVDVDVSNQPAVITFDFVGSIDAAFGASWSPDISGSFAYDDLYPTMTVTYPDTTFDASVSAQVIPAGGSEFTLSVEFSEAITGFDTSDLTVTGGTVTQVSSSSVDTVWTVTVQPDLTQQPSDIVVEMTGTVQTGWGLEWRPVISATFAYPASGFTFSDRQNDTNDDWGATRTNSDTDTAVVYSSTYATTLANGVLAGAVELSAADLMNSTEMELVQVNMEGGISSYRGTIQIGDEVYSAEMHVTASGAHNLRIFDPERILIARGPEYTGSLVGTFNYTGVLTATEYASSSETLLEGDFTLTADFTNNSFTISDGPSQTDAFSLLGFGVLDSTTGTIASDTMNLLPGDQADLSALDPVFVVAFGNIQGDGTDVSGLFYSDDGIDLHYTGSTGQYVGAFVGSQ